MKKLIYPLVFLFFVFQGSKAQNSNSEKTEALYKEFKTEFQWDAKVKIGSMINVGKSKSGERRVIPILGGTFVGPKIKGEVLPGGEDWQLVRPDGDTELHARYLMKTDDGYTFQVLNRALIHVDDATKTFYCKSVLEFEAPLGSPYVYLNHAVFLGTLQIPELKPGEETYVVISVYKVL